MDLGPPVGHTAQASRDALPPTPPMSHGKTNDALTNDPTATRALVVEPPPPVVDAPALAPAGSDVAAHAPAPDVPTTSPGTDTAAAAPTSTIDPDKPSAESAPTALPTNPTTHPAEQAEAVKDEHPAVVGREIEKTKAAERELKGEPPKGTVVHGIEDDRLWAMLRRFDVQISHVLHPATNLPPTEPDLRPSTLPNLPSHSDTLKSNMERVFAAVGPASLLGARELGRMTSWAPEERSRTAAFCISYFVCWLFGYTLVGCFTFFVALACFPKCRRWFFPPVQPPPFTPPSATDPTNKAGDESLIGNVDSKTVHRSKAEQAEEQAFEARALLQAYTQRVVFDGRKKGKNAGNANVGEKVVEPESDLDDDEADPTNAKTKPQGLVSADVKVGDEHIALDEKTDDKKKKKIAQQAAKQKRDELVGKMTKATEDGLGAFADLMERMTNALSPPSAYPDRNARFKIAGAFLVPPMLLLHFTPAWLFGRIATFGIGVGLWGRPLIAAGIRKFVLLVPNWQDYLDLRNSILSGVPTDAQLTLHLLRVGEALGTPLPRPPPAPLEGTPKEAIKDTTPATITADDHAEVEEAAEEGGVAEKATKAKVKTKSHILGAFKAVGKKMAGFHGDVAVDGARKKIGTKVDKVLFQNRIKDDGSRDEFPAKYDGTSGHIILDAANEATRVPRIAFVPLSGKDAAFQFAVDDIVELKKAHVSMPRMALGWASGADVEGLGLTIRAKPLAQQAAEAAGAEKVDGTTVHLTRVGRREDLFVRLVSMGRQRWEVL
ncbi:hypothetical protein Q5752_003325 [Cryptotrichosporon argae]